MTLLDKLASGVLLLTLAGCGSSEQSSDSSNVTGGVNTSAVTGGTTAVSTGGRPSNVGGRATAPGGGTSTTCQPSDMSSYVYPAYVPARHSASSCTPSLVSQYYTDCFSGTDCSDFQSGSAHENCGACLAETGLQESTYGPILTYGSNTASMFEINLAGCIELMGEPGCAAKYQKAQLCAINACLANCPISDQASLTALQSCMASTKTTVCANLQAATNCIAKNTTVTACTGADFAAQYLALGSAFCVN